MVTAFESDNKSKTVTTTHAAEWAKHDPSPQVVDFGPAIKATLNGTFLDEAAGVTPASEIPPDASSAYGPKVKSWLIQSGKRSGYVVVIQDPFSPAFLERARVDQYENVLYCTNEDFGGKTGKNVLKSFRGPNTDACFGMSNCRQLIETIPLTTFDKEGLLPCTNFLKKIIFDSHEEGGCPLKFQKLDNNIQEAHGDVAGSAYGAHRDCDLTNSCNDEMSFAYGKLPTASEQIVITFTQSNKVGRCHAEVTWRNDPNDADQSPKEQNLLVVTTKGQTITIQGPGIQRFIHSIKGVGNGMRNVKSFRHILDDPQILSKVLSRGGHQQKRYDQRARNIHHCESPYFCHLGFSFWSCLTLSCYAHSTGRPNESRASPD